MPFKLKNFLALALLGFAGALATTAGAAEAAGSDNPQPALQQGVDAKAKSFLERQNALLCDYMKSRQKYLLACSELAAILAKDEISKKFKDASAELGKDAKTDIAKISLAVSSLFKDAECSAILNLQGAEIESEALKRYAEVLNLFSESFAMLVEIANKIPSLASGAKDILKAAPKEEEKLRLTDAVEPTIALGNQIVEDLKSAKELSARLVKFAKDAKLAPPKELADFAK